MAKVTSDKEGKVWSEGEHVADRKETEYDDGGKKTTDRDPESGEITDQDDFVPE